MLPDGSYTPVSEDDGSEAAAMPSLTYHLHQKRVRGYIDELNAVKQAVYLRLSTEKGSSSIYSAAYGIQTADLIGAPRGLILGRLPRRIRETLLQDDRITDVTDFAFQFPERDSVEVQFRVHSIFGVLDEQYTVKVGGSCDI